MADKEYRGFNKAEKIVALIVGLLTIFAMTFGSWYSGKMAAKDQQAEMDKRVTVLEITQKDIIEDQNNILEEVRSTNDNIVKQNENHYTMSVER